MPIASASSSTPPPINRAARGDGAALEGGWRATAGTGLSMGGCGQRVPARSRRKLVARLPSRSGL
jgi:hypothetical protein